MASMGRGRGQGGGGLRHNVVESPREDVSHAQKRTSWEMFGKILFYLRKYPWYARGTMGCAVLTTLFALSQPKLTQVVIDHVIEKQRADLLALYVAGLIIAFILRDGFNSLRIRLNNTFEQRVIFDMRCDLYHKLQQLPVSYYDKRSTGDIMTRVVDDVNSFERVLIDGIEQGTVAVITMVGALAMLLGYHYQLGLIALIPIPALLAGGIIFTRTAHGRQRVVRRAVSLLNSLLHDNLQGIRQIKGFAREDHESHRFSSRADEVQKGTLSAMKAWSIYNPSMSLAAAMGIVLILYFGGLKVISGELSVGALVGLLGYVSMFYDPTTRLHNLNQLFQAGRAAGERIFDILDYPEEAHTTPNAVTLAQRVKGDVKFEDVHFAYQSDLPILNGISFHAPAGHTVALVGPTGAGKSTVINLLPRFYETTAGKILVDGRSVCDIRMKSLRDQVGIVSQEPFLFNGSIRENILYGNLAADEKTMIDAAKAANVHDFVMRLPEGYDSKVGERGVKLSVGEKQRVSIARALLKDPPILLLDEATASVDTATERLIQEALERLMSHRTCLVIAHRLSTIRNADLILVLEHGKIIERGTHDELLGQGGLYAKLCRIQDTQASIEVALETIEKG